MDGASLLRAAWDAGLGPVTAALIPWALLFALPLPGHIRPRLMPIQGILLWAGFAFGATAFPPAGLLGSLSSGINPAILSWSGLGLMMGGCLLLVLVFRLQQWGPPLLQSLLLIPLGALLAFARPAVEGPVLASLPHDAETSLHFIYWLCAGFPLALTFVVGAWFTGWMEERWLPGAARWTTYAWVAGALAWMVGPVAWANQWVLLRWPFLLFG